MYYYLSIVSLLRLFIQQVIRKFCTVISLYNTEYFAGCIELTKPSNNSIYLSICHKYYIFDRNIFTVERFLLFQTSAISYPIVAFLQFKPGQCLIYFNSKRIKLTTAFWGLVHTNCVSALPAPAYWASHWARRSVGG